MYPVFVDQPGDPVQFVSAEPTRFLEYDRVKPELGYLVLSHHMNVRRLGIVHRNKEESIGTFF
jgi:hypothetical protein